MDFLTIDPGTIIMTLLNTLILFLLLRHFLFKRVNAMLESRKTDVETTYKDADTAKSEAVALQAEYTQKLAAAKEESAELVSRATKKAQSRSDEIIFAAKDEVTNLMLKAESDISREKKRAVNQIKNEISEIAIAVASKVVEKEITSSDNDRLIEDFIANVGDLK